MRRLAFIRSLGSGAVGTVYLADLVTERGFRRQVAVKVLLGERPGAEQFLTRMRDEARLLGLLNDERVLEVAELVRVADRDAVIMEYVEGIDLGSLVERRQPVPSRALAEVGAMVAGALHKAHTATHPATGEPLNVIHRDVKPANIMITMRGSVKLLDFGVARAHFEARESYTGQLVLGTLNYMAPEYIVTGQVTRAADLYGLGISLWEAASGKIFGQPRIRRERFEAAVAEGLASIRPTHGELVPFLDRMLCWDPERRPDGATIERELMAAADAMRGSSLRTWAAEALPPLRAAGTQPGKDPIGLVGTEHDLQGDPDQDRDRSVPRAPARPPGIEDPQVGRTAPPAHPAPPRPAAPTTPLPAAETVGLPAPSGAPGSGAFPARNQPPAQPRPPHPSAPSRPSPLPRPSAPLAPQPGPSAPAPTTPRPPQRAPTRPLAPSHPPVASPPRPESNLGLAVKSLLVGAGIGFLLVVAAAVLLLGR